ncbi:MAG: phosphohydrolase [Haloplasmataceae bacterium]|nr:phosphohydrolase [Haloplasmataceae bacterium]
MKENGFKIYAEGNALDQIKLLQSELKLLASDGGFEIMIQELGDQALFDIYPNEDESALFEFFYLIDGQLEYLSDNDETIMLNQGDYFYLKKITKILTFKAISKAKLFFVTSQPMFHYLGETLELQKMNEEIDKKDQYTYEHCKRVENMAIKIAKEMHLDRDRITRLAVAAIFHDLGKININDDILLKPDKLTPEEFRDVKMHPINSAKYVKKIKYVDVSGIVLQHHERVDGSGYPRGLTGNQISLEAKIIGVADAYDAMISERPYRKAFTIQEAVNDIVRYTNKWYDKDVVNAFVETMRKDGLLSE